MKSCFLLLFTTLLGATVSGCNLQLGCTEVGCSDTVNVTIESFAGKQMGALPFLVTACVEGDSCSTFKIIKPSADTFECTVTSGSAFFCNVRSPGGNLDFSLVLTAAQQAAATVSLSVTVTDSTSTKVFDQQQFVTVETSMPNGPGCEPTCHQGAATFTL